MRVIAVADHAKELDLFDGGRFSAEYEAALERVLRNLFAASPGFSDAWEAVAESFDEEVGPARAVPFCLERGFDIRKEPGDDASGMVGCWRDVGIMLLARDRGLTA